MDKALKHSVILHNIRSTHNVGSIFRTVDTLGISKIYLTGITATPRDRFGRERADIAKTALGAEKSVPWEHTQNIQDLLEKLKKENTKIVSVEQSKNSIDYKKADIAGATAFVFGNELEGIPSDVLKTSDLVLEIPMRGKKESLNVAVAAGVLLFRLLDN